MILLGDPEALDSELSQGCYSSALLLSDTRNLVA